MKKIAVEKATAHLAKARRALAALERAKRFDVFEEAWGDFLTEYGRFLSKLQTGSKVNPQSRQWYGALKRQCRDDPLMAYLFQARNAAEHGLGDVARLAADAGRMRFPASKEVTLSMSMRINEDGSMDVKNPKVVTEHGEFTGVELWNARAELVTVYDDRFPQDRWDPPQMHGGRPIVDRSPAGLAKMALIFMDVILADAAKLPE